VLHSTSLDNCHCYFRYKQDSDNTFKSSIRIRTGFGYSSKISDRLRILEYLYPIRTAGRGRTVVMKKTVIGNRSSSENSQQTCRDFKKT